MWDELLPKFVGGTITDMDAPDEPSEIIGFKLTDDWVEVQTAAGWSFGGKRDLMGINGIASKDGPVESQRCLMRSPWMSAVIELPRPK